MLLIFVQIVAAGPVDEWTREDADFEQHVLRNFFGNARLVAELYNTDFLNSEGPWTVSTKRFIIGGLFLNDSVFYWHRQESFTNASTS